MARCASPRSDHIATFALGLYAGAKRVWPIPQLRWLVATEAQSLVGTDQFGRLLSYPGKIEITCPIQDAKTAVLLLVGHSNAANYHGQRHQSADDRVVNFVDGRCYRAASPLLGADGQRGETWTLLGNKLVQSGLYHTVILIPAAVGGSSVRRWAAGATSVLMVVKSLYVRPSLPRRVTASDCQSPAPRSRRRQEISAPTK